MTIVEFLSHIHSLDIELWIEDGRLCYSAPQGALTPALRSELVARKGEILAFLREASDSVDVVRPPIVPISKDGPLPLSFAQQRLWLLDQLSPGNSIYNLPVTLHLTGPLNVSALGQSLNALVQRHQVLRTRFATVEDCPIQVIASELVLVLPVVDLSDLPVDERKVEARRLTAEDAQRVFDLTRDTLVRFTLLRLGGDQYTLLLNMHHIISDGWSMGVFNRELSVLYEALCTGVPSPLPDLPIQYADFAVWQREWLQGEVLEKQLAYWKQQLGGDLPVLELPLDYPRPPVQTYRGGHQTLMLPRVLCDALGVLSRGENVTLFMTLLAAFKTLLYRYTGQTDVMVGSPIAGRNLGEVEELIGFFLNTLVLRTDLSGNPSFGELLGRVSEVALEAYAQQDLPFEKLLEELRPERDLSRTPMFQVFFNMLNLPYDKVEMQGLKVDVVAPPEIGSKFDMTLYVDERDAGIQLDLVYNADLFSPDRMAEMLKQFRFLLSQVVECPDTKIDHYSLVTCGAEAILPDPTRVLSSKWEGAVHTLFSQQAQRVPERLAVVDGQESWTYKALAARSNQLANYLCDKGIGSEDVVAIYGYRSAALVWAVLGVLRAGAAFFILDPMYPVSHLMDCLRKARPGGWLQVKAAGDLPEALEEFVALSYRWRLELPDKAIAAESDPLRDCSTDEPGIAVGPDDLACVVFTSGSTGRPKGILGKHGPLSHFLPWQREAFALCDWDRYSMLSGLSHDPLQRDIFTSLALGATLCVPDPEQMGNPGWLAEWMRREEISITHLTPAMMQVLTQVPPGTAASMHGVPSLRYAFVVGDVLTKKDVLRLEKLAPWVTCVNYYGATETQRAVGYCVVPKNKGQIAGEVIPLGRGVQDVQLLVLNAAQRLAGVGELGEIYVRSPHLAKGYLGDDALTAERFMINFFTGKAGDRLFKTGDLGRYLPDGNVTFLGRVDRQVKIRGFRIEPGGIEAVIGQHPAVQEVVVVAAPLTCGEGVEEKRLVAYIVPTPGRVPTSGELQSFLRNKLPHYMVPSAWVMIEALPLTATGKVDLRALPAPGVARPELEETFVSPRTPIEEALAGMLAQVLGIEQVGIHDDFFELGGHSLMATRVLSQMREKFRIEIPLRTLFEAPTVASLTERVEMALRSSGAAGMPSLQPVSRDQELPVSFVQERWLLRAQKYPSLIFNTGGAFRLRGSLDVVALTGSLEEIVRRHEILRTTFTTVEGGWVQVVSPTRSLTVRMVDLRELPKPEREAEVRHLATQDRLRPFDRSQDTLLRATLVQLDEKDHTLILWMDHIASDGWSVNVLCQELSLLYEAFSTGAPAPLPELTIQYVDFAYWQRQRLQGVTWESLLSHWRDQLEGLRFELPTDHPRSEDVDHRGAWQELKLPAALVEALEALSRQERATLFMVLLAGFQALLQCYTDQDDVVVLSPVANRPLPEAEVLIGAFAHSVALRADFSGDPSFRELLAQVREAVLGADAHSGLPFGMLMRALRTKFSLGSLPRLPAYFSFGQSAQERLPKFPGLAVSPLEKDTELVLLDLNLWIMEKSDGLTALMIYRAGLFDAATIDRMLKVFRALLESIVTDPEQRLLTLQLPGD